MDLLLPSAGLVFWTAISFGIVLYLLSKFAWGPITEALKEREETIKDALEAADRAKMEMATLKSENEKLLAEAREERSLMLKEAKESGNKIVSDAKEQAKKEAGKIMEDATNEIQNQKMAAIIEVKNKVGTLAIEITKKILKKELSEKSEQEAYANDLVKLPWVPSDGRETETFENKWNGRASND